MLAFVRRWQAWIALAGLCASVVAFAVDLPRHADRGSWGDLATVAAHNWFPIGIVLLIGFLNRSRTLYHLLGGWFSGYFLAMSIAYLLLRPLESAIGENEAWFVSVAVPIIEEAAKALPLLILYALYRRKLWMRPTVTDFAVLGLAVGGGFAFHEDALYGRVSGSGWAGWGQLFPAFVTDGTFAVGHGGWTGIVGLAVGCARARRGRSWAWVPVAAAYVLVVVDHGLVNDGAERELLGGGRFLAYLLVGGIAVTLLFELRVVASASGGFAALRSDMRRAVHAVGTGEGILGRARRFQTLTFLLRRTIRIIWFARTEGRSQELARGRAPTSQRDERRRAAFALAGVAVAIALVYGLTRGTDGRDDVAATGPFVGAEVRPDPVDAAPTTPTTSPLAADAGAAQVGSGELTLTEPVLIRRRWEVGRRVYDELLVVDGNRELHRLHDRLNYSDGTNTVSCSNAYGDTPSCFVDPEQETLGRKLAYTDWTGGSSAGAETSRRTIAGIDATCFGSQRPRDEPYSFVCVDPRTNIELLRETNLEDIGGGFRFSRIEVLAISIPTEQDFELPPEAEATLREIGG